MKEKQNRLSAIKDIIKSSKIDNQDTLLQMLNQKGFDITQATLSRDLKALKVGKISDGGSGYYYSLHDEKNIVETDEHFIQDVRRGIVSIEFSGSMGVIKTRAGSANSVCYALDALNLPEILGTIAGDDTIFIILRENSTKEDLLNEFRIKIPEIG